MQWLKLETAAANITGIKKGRCRYSTLCIAYGPNGQPFARGIKELFVLWFKVLLHMANTQPQVFADPANSFLLIKESILHKQGILTFDNMHKHIQGLISHVLVYLLALTWTPHSIIEWSNPLGDRYLFTPDQPFPVMTHIFNILDSYHHLKAQEAQNHYHSASLTNTVAWHQSLTRNRYLKNKKGTKSLRC